MIRIIYFLSAAFFTLTSAAQHRIASYHVENTSKWKVKIYDNDPLKVREYTFVNGLTLITSQNDLQPRISSMVAVKAGSKNDPSDHTGLAHYLEHMLFKGTDKYGTLNWGQEKQLLDRIDSLYEVYNHLSDENARKNTYREIDSVSQLAATYAIANEYDKMCQAMGATGTNAFTGEDMTVYVNDIPSNMLHKWVELEAERYRNPVLRLFHTELEAVYEEKNISLDNDNTKVWEKLNAELFSQHNYGKQTTIGSIEHLKNPSLIAIRDYYKKYYVPNNMAIILCGDFDPDIAADAIAEHFEYMKPSTIEQLSFPPEPPYASPRTFDVLGPDAEYVTIGYRIPGADFNKGRDLRAVRVIDLLLSNQSAGLIDINLVKKQKVLSAYSTLDIKKDYSMLILSGKPKAGQSLEEVRDLLTEQLNLIINGAFDDELLKSVILNTDISRIRDFKENASRGYFLMDAFVREIGYQNEYNELWAMSQTRKVEIMEIAKEYLNRDRVEIFKRKGEDKEVLKITKPEIHPVELNRDKQSVFVTNWLDEPTSPIVAEFADFNTIETYNLKKQIPLYYTHNNQNRLFKLEYIYEFGSYHNNLLPFALQYLLLSGTESLSQVELSKKLYSLGCSIDAIPGAYRSKVVVSGPNESFDEAIRLIEDLMIASSSESDVLANLIADELKKREDAKLNSRIIASRLSSYALYGPVNPMNYVPSGNALESLKTSDLLSLIQKLKDSKHAVSYYGQRAGNDVISVLDKFHYSGAGQVHLPAVNFAPRDVKSNEVLFVNYDMVQASIFWTAKGPAYSASQAPVIDLFNQYFGGDMSSVVFQNIRESKALAYSTYAVYVTPTKSNEYFYMKAFVGTQSDKMQDAINGMNELLNDMPENENVLVLSKESLKNRIETERIDPENLVNYWYSLRDLGQTQDSRMALYKALPALSMSDLRRFHKEQISKAVYSYAVVGSDSRISLKDLSKYGKVTTLGLKDIFGY